MEHTLKAVIFTEWVIEGGEEGLGKQNCETSRPVKRTKV